MTEILDTADFLHRARRKLRYGHFTREPLTLLKLQWTEDRLKCDWLMRPPDVWDRALPTVLVERHQTHQALRDALDLRDLLFEAFPKASVAELRMYRRLDQKRFELMLAGTISRTNEVLSRVPSVAMRAKLCGFRFTLTEGVLESLRPAPVGLF